MRAAQAISPATQPGEHGVEVATGSPHVTAGV
jgi:hypothetical protein